MSDNKQQSITFISIYSKKQETYSLRNNESLTDAKCPIDGTFLYSGWATTTRAWEEEKRYFCPNCNESYYSLEPKRLEHSKQIQIEERKKKLAEIRAQESWLVKFLEAAGEKV